MVRTAFNIYSKARCYGLYFAAHAMSAFCCMSLCSGGRTAFNIYSKARLSIGCFSANAHVACYLCTVTCSSMMQLGAGLLAGAPQACSTSAHLHLALNCCTLPQVGKHSEALRTALKPATHLPVDVAS